MENRTDLSAANKPQSAILHSAVEKENEPLKESSGRRYMSLSHSSQWLKGSLEQLCTQRQVSTWTTWGTYRRRSHKNKCISHKYYVMVGNNTLGKLEQIFYNSTYMMCWILLRQLETSYRILQGGSLS